MDVGAPFVKTLRRIGLVVHSSPLETLRLSQVRDRINRLCRESSFVVYVTLSLIYIDDVLIVRDSYGKRWSDTYTRTKGRCRTEDDIFARMTPLWRYLSSRGVPQFFVVSVKCSLCPINSVQRVFESTNVIFAWHDSCQHGIRFNFFLKWRVPNFWMCLQTLSRSCLTAPADKVIGLTCTCLFDVCCLNRRLLI